VGNDNLEKSIEGDLECVSYMNGTYTNITITGYNCTCACKRMYLTFETFSNIWFWILLILGLWCLINAVLSHIKDRDWNRTWCPVTAYRLAEKFAKLKPWEEERRKREEASAKSEAEKKLIPLVMLPVPSPEIPEETWKEMEEERKKEKDDVSARRQRDGKSGDEMILMALKAEEANF